MPRQSQLRGKKYQQGCDCSSNAGSAMQELSTRFFGGVPGAKKSRNKAGC